MNYSENYNFALPEDKDGYDISPLNENFEALDGILGENESTMEEINKKIGTPTENGQTLFSLLGNKSPTALTAIKSIQHVIFEAAANSTSGSVAISKVTPTKCMVFLERLKDISPTGCNDINYTLKESSISITHNNYSESKVKLGFWIIEFC